ncbi:MAG: hypothetical protein WBK51_15495 [Polaromonas sp.]
MKPDVNDNTWMGRCKGFSQRLTGAWNAAKRYTQDDSIAIISGAFCARIYWLLALHDM